MKALRVEVSRPYEVLIGGGLLDGLGARCAESVSGRQAILVSDSRVFPIYGEIAARSLRGAGFELCEYVFPAGEKSKTPETLFEIINTAAEHGLDRGDLFVALGGGVCGDLCGLAAALYCRGTAFVQVPTSLLAMVDASVGGKTAVDLPAGKNLAGTFHQPALVLCDVDCLHTLPDKFFSDGMAEAIKCACLGGKRFFEGLERPEPPDMEELIYACIRLKAELVAGDEFDAGVRQLLNFGHTLGHAIEKCSGYGIAHGSAVAIGMAMITRGCVRLRMCEPGLDSRLEALLRRYKLPVRTNLPLEEVIAASRSDKKRRGSGITLVLPCAAGECRLETLPFQMLETIAREGM